MNNRKTPSVRIMAVFLLAIALLAGCAAPAPKAPVEKGTVFYPPAPDLPRVQYLASFANARDLGAQASALANFIVGDDKLGEELKRPYGVAMRDGRIYVADNRLSGLAVFDLKSKQFSIDSGSSAGRMQRPINVTIDAGGSKYVTDTGRNQVLVYDRKDRFVSAFGEKGQFKPVDTALLGERLYVVDIQHHEVWVLNKRDGKLLFKFGKAGSGKGELYHPTNLAVGPEGDIYVVETSNFRVSRFSAQGTFISSFGEAGQGPGQFARPKGIAVDRAGRIYVGDAAFQNVQIFDRNGRVLMAFGQPGEGAPGALNLPAGIAIDYDNVGLFRRYADPKFTLEYVILVVSQFGPNKVDVFGFGRMGGVIYPPDDQALTRPAR